MGSQAQNYTDIYLSTHEARLQASIEQARAELLNKYNANSTYLKYIDEQITLYEKELTKIQETSAKYAEARGGRVGVSADDTAKLLGVIATAGNTIADATGDAAQRKLESEAAVEGRYRLSGEQSNAIGKAGEFITSSADLQSASTPADVLRIVDAAIGQIGPGTFTTGSDAAKTATAELFQRLNRALGSNSTYASNVGLAETVAKKINQKLGTAFQFSGRSAVEADKAAAIKDAARLVGVTGTGISQKAADLAGKALDAAGGNLSPVDKKEVNDWSNTPQGSAYREQIMRGASYEEAFAAAAKALPEGALASVDLSNENEVAAIVFKTTKADGTPGKDIRTMLQDAGVSFDVQKDFDPTYIGMRVRSRRITEKLGAPDGSGLYAKKGDLLEGLLETPTEEAVRRRATEIYEPISPGVQKRAAAQTGRLEEAEAFGGYRRREGTGAGTVDDLLASRMKQGAAPLSDAQKITSGAAASAVRFGPKFIPAGEWDAAGDSGFRLYSNVRDRLLKDTSPEGLVKHASDLANGDPILRDTILQGYYQWTLGEKRGLETQKRAASVQAVETGTPPSRRDQPDIPMGGEQIIPERYGTLIPDNLRDLFLKEESDKERGAPPDTKTEKPPPPVFKSNRDYEMLEGIEEEDIPTFVEYMKRYSRKKAEDGVKDKEDE